MSISTKNNSWIGKHYSELIEVYGEPVQVFKDGSGGKIFSWSLIPVDEGLLDEPRTKSTFGTGSNQVYWINTKGVIYRKGF